MTTSDLILRQEDLLDNPTNRVPIALCLDVSHSMSGEPIDELNSGVTQFLAALRADAVAAASAEVAMIAFADRATVVLDFQALDRVTEPPVLRIGSDLGSSTNLGGGVNLALDALEARKQDYRRAGVDYFQPFMILMTDGQPTTDVHCVAAPRTCELEAQRKLVVMPIGIGAYADMGVLGQFSKKNEPLRLRGLAFGAFFSWLSKSVVRVSQSRPGERVALDTKGIKGWADIGQ